MEAETQFSPPHSGILYVVFHGDLVFTDIREPDPHHRSHYIRVRTPDLDQHVFMAGPWLGERHIPKGAMLQLNGVEFGTESIHCHTDQFVIFKKAPGNPDAMPYFEILFRRPEAILKGDLYTFKPGTLVIDTPGVTFEVEDPSQDPSVDLRPIFKYRVSPGCHPFLSTRQGDGDDFPTWPAGKGQPGFYSLHVFAEPDQDFGAGHSQMAFRESAGLLGVEADIQPVEDGKRALDIKSDSLSEFTDRIPGLIPDEYLMPLRDRVVTLKDLGNQRRHGCDTLTWKDGQHAHHHPKPTGHVTPEWVDAGSCGPTGN